MLEQNHPTRVGSRQGLVFLGLLVILSGQRPLAAADLRARRPLPSCSGSSVELELPETPRLPAKLAPPAADAIVTPLPTVSEILTVLGRSTGPSGAMAVTPTGVAVPLAVADRAPSPVRLRQLAAYVDRYRHAKVPLPKQKPYDSSFAIYAAHTNQPAALELFASAGEDLTRADKIGQTPLVVAVIQGHVAVIEKLRLLGVTATPSAVLAAMEHGQPAAMRALLVQKTVTVTPALIARARQRGQTEIAELLAGVVAERKPS